MTTSIAHLIIDDNEEGWGPSTIPEKFKDVPYYAPFNKGDKIGRAADWQQQNQGKSRYAKNNTGENVSTIFSWHYQDDDSTFQLVDNQRGQLKRTAAGGRRFQKNFQQRQQRGHNTNFQNNNAYQAKKAPSNSGGFQQVQQRKYVQRKYDNNNQRKRDPSVEIKPDWNQVEELAFAGLNKATSDEKEGQNIKSYGSVEYWDKAYDRVPSKLEKPLERIDSRTFFNVTTGDDPIIRQLSKEDVGNVFATDVILSHLMNSTKSVFPWDITVTRVGSKLFFDKRDGTQFDYMPVNETATEPPIEDPRDPNNSPAALAREATFINQSFSQQVLSKEDKPVDFPNPNPFTSEGQVPASVGYRYRKFQLSEDCVVVARCEVDALNKGKKDSYITVRALNEFDLKGTDWRKKIDSQRGAVFATELKSNHFKLLKWAAQAVLAGSDNIKLGFVSRATQKDNYNHVILATQDYSSREFVSTINLNMKNAWGVLKKIVDACMKQPTGKYVLIRDPEKGFLRLYSVPEDMKADSDRS